MRGDESGSARCSETEPRRVNHADHSFIIPPEEGFVNRHAALMAKYQLSRAQIIEALKEKYPAFDKALESKCEHPDRYGIELTTEAWMYLNNKFGGEDNGKTD